MRSIQIVLYTGLTDVILALPALRALRGHYPKARLSVVTSPASRELLALVPWIDEVIAVARWRRAEILHPAKGYRTLRELWRLRRLATEGMEPDLTIDLSGGLGSYLLREVIGGREVASPPGGGGGGLLTRAPQDLHRSHLYLRRLKPLGVRPLTAFPELQTNPDADRRVDRLLRHKGRKKGLDTDHLLIGVQPGRGDGSGDEGWPLDRFATLCRRLISNFNARIVIITGPGERRRGIALAESIPPQESIRLDPLPLADFISLVARMSTVIGDAGAAVHLAAAVGTPVAAISISRGSTPTDIIAPAAITIRAPHYDLPDLHDEETVFQSACQLIGLPRTTLFRDRL